MLPVIRPVLHNPTLPQQNSFQPIVILRAFIQLCIVRSRSAAFPGLALRTVLSRVSDRRLFLQIA